MRRLGSIPVHPVGLGCMNMSGGYLLDGPRPLPDAECEALLNRALDLGYTHFDTAAVYGAGHSETMIGKFLKSRRADYTLATKIGFAGGGTTGARGVDSRPETLGPAFDACLQRLQTDCVDLLYLHRWNPEVPIEDVVGTLGRFVDAGKARQIGLSEVSADTMRKAHIERPIAAIQTEYSPWTRNPEIAVLDACSELGVTFVAFSPLARKFLTGTLPDAPEFAEGDIRKSMPRFQSDGLAANRKWFSEYVRIAERVGCTPGQLALAWGLSKHPALVTIPGTANLAHLEENHAAAAVLLSEDIVAELDALVPASAVFGARYTAGMQATVGTEEFPAEGAS